MWWGDCSTQSLRSSEWWRLHHLKVETSGRQTLLHNCLSNWRARWKDIPATQCFGLEWDTSHPGLPNFKGAGKRGEYMEYLVSITIPDVGRLYKVCYKGKERDEVISRVTGGEWIFFSPPNWKRTEFAHRTGHGWGIEHCMGPGEGGRGNDGP